MIKLLKAEIKYISVYILIGVACVIFFNFLVYIGQNKIAGNRLIVLFFGALIYFKFLGKDKRISMLALLPIKPINIALLRLIIPTIFIVVFLLSDIFSRIIFNLFLFMDFDYIWIMIVIVYLFIVGPSIVSDEPIIVKNPYLSSLFTILGLTIFVVGGFLTGLSMGLTGIIASILIIDTTLIVTSIFTFVHRSSFIN